MRGIDRRKGQTFASTPAERGTSPDELARFERVVDRLFLVVPGTILTRILLPGHVKDQFPKRGGG